jgi:assimilatory nitrate reductase catalytic subunit
MIVCHCRVVSDKTIRGETESGACTVGDVARRCGAGTGCGACRPTIAALLAVHAAYPAAETVHSAA